MTHVDSKLDYTGGAASEFYVAAVDNSDVVSIINENGSNSHGPHSVLEG